MTVTSDVPMEGRKKISTSHHPLDVHEFKQNYRDVLKDITKYTCFDNISLHGTNGNDRSYRCPYGGIKISTSHHPLDVQVKQAVLKDSTLYTCYDNITDRLVL